MLAFLYGDWLACSEVRSPCTGYREVDGTGFMPREPHIPMDSPGDKIYTKCGGAAFKSPETSKNVDSDLEASSLELAAFYNVNVPPSPRGRAFDGRRPSRDYHGDLELLDNSTSLLDGESAPHVVSAIAGASALRRASARRTGSPAALHREDGRERRRGSRSGRSTNARRNPMGGGSGSASRQNDWKANLLSLPEKNDMLQRSIGRERALTPRSPRSMALSRVERERSIRDEDMSISSTAHEVAPPPPRALSP